MLVRLNPAVRILPPTGVTGDRWVVEDLLRKRRFNLSRPLVAALVAAAEAQELSVLANRLPTSGSEWPADLVRHELLVDASSESDDQRWLVELIGEWERAGWREAAEYHVLTFDYPCLDYAEVSTVGLDRARMRSYQSVEPDDDRYKLDYTDRPGMPIAAPEDTVPVTSAAKYWTGEPPGRPVDAESLLTTISLAFAVTAETRTVTDAAPLLQRTAPSGGGRNPTEGYVAVRRVPGVAPGWYHVTLRPFSLRLVRSDRLDEGTMRSLFPDTSGPAAVVVLTSVFERNMYRYREPRTFRTVHMDAGHLAGTVRLVGSALGLKTAVSLAGDAPAVEELLGLDGMVEGYLAAVALHDGVPTPLPDTAHSPLATVVPAEIPADEVVAEPHHWPLGTRIRPVVGTSELEVANTVTGRTRRYRPAELAEVILNSDGPPAEAQRGGLLAGLRHWQRRGWHPSDQFYVASRRSRPGVGAEVGNPQPVTTAGEPLPEPASPGDVSISTLLLNRRSGRAYMRRPVAASVLSGLLWHGLAGHREESVWEFCVCVYNVAGLAPGAYRYRPGTHRLHLTHPGDLRDAMTGVLQGMRSPHSAGWTLGLVADFARGQRAQPHEMGLRNLYTEAGIIAQELIVLGGSYQLGTLVTPAQQDSEYLRLHDLPRSRYGPIYTLTMGLSRGAAGVYPEGFPALGEGERSA